MLGRHSGKHTASNFTNIIIEISDAKNKLHGFGEGCLPKHDKIFLEDWIKAAASFISVNTFPWCLNNIYEIRTYVESLPVLSSLNPVVCAIETALLDLLGRWQNKPLSAYFPSHHTTGFVRYGAHVPTGFSRRQTITICRAAKRLGIKTIRLGVDSSPRRTLNRLETVTRILGNGCALLLNPDFSWDPDIAAAHMPLLERFPVRALEDPMPDKAKGFTQLAATFKSRGIKLIAGQSAASIETAVAAVDNKLYDTVSVQLSRSGGFHRSLKLIDFLRRTGFDFQIGCHPAEACILSAAGNALNLLCNDAVDREAACFRFMADPTMAPDQNLLSYGGGATASIGTGLGMHVNGEAVSNLKKNRFDGKRTTLTIKSAAASS